MAVISINYNEGGSNLGYKSVDLSCGDSLFDKVFNSGDFVRDWYNVWKWINTNEINEPIMYSSSVDHFIGDSGDKWDSGYLHFVNDKPVLKYPNREVDNWFLNPDFDGLEVFVNRGERPTWEEYSLSNKDNKY
jgi:hypothetical protein